MSLKLRRRPIKSFHAELYFFSQIYFENKSSIFMNPDFSKFVFSTSHIPDGADFEDCIRIASIDFVANPPNEDDATSVFAQLLNELNNKTVIKVISPNISVFKRRIIIELIIKLSIAIYQRNECQSKCENVIQSQYINEETTISLLNPDVITFLISIGKIANVAKDINDNLIQTIIDMKTLKDNNIIYHNINISQSHAIFLIVNSIRYLFKDGYQASQRSNQIILKLCQLCPSSNQYEKDILEGDISAFSHFYKTADDLNLLNLFEENESTAWVKYYLLTQISVYNSPVIFENIDMVSPAFFEGINQNLLKYISKSKELPSEQVIKYVQKCEAIYQNKKKEFEEKHCNDNPKIEFDPNILVNSIVDTNSAVKLFEFLSPKEVTENNLWNFLEHYNSLNVGSRFARQYLDYKPNQFLFMRIQPHATRIMPGPIYIKTLLDTTQSMFHINEHGEEYLTKPDSYILYPLYNAFAISHMNSLDIPNIVDFWYYFASKVGFQAEIKQYITLIISKYFDHDKSASFYSFLYDLLMKDLQITSKNKNSDGVFNLLKGILEFELVFYNGFMRYPRLQELLVPNLHQTPAFWSLFSTVDQFVPYINTKPCALTGISYILYKNPSIPVPESISLEVQTQNQSTESIIKDFIENYCDSIDHVFSFSTENEVAFSLISAAIFFTVTSPKRPHLNLKLTGFDSTVFFFIVLKMLGLLYDFSPKKYIGDHPYLKMNFALLFILPEKSAEITSFVEFILQEYINLIRKKFNEFAQSGMLGSFTKQLSLLWTNDLMNNNHSYIVPLLSLLLHINSLAHSKDSLVLILSGLPKLMPFYYSHFYALCVDEYENKMNFKKRVNQLFSKPDFGPFNITEFINDKLENHFEESFNLNHISFVCMVRILRRYFYFNDKIEKKIDEITQHLLDDGDSIGLTILYNYKDSCAARFKALLSKAPANQKHEKHDKIVSLVQSIDNKDELIQAIRERQLKPDVIYSILHILFKESPDDSHRKQILIDIDAFSKIKNLAANDISLFQFVYNMLFNNDMRINEYRLSFEQYNHDECDVQVPMYTLLTQFYTDFVSHRIELCRAINETFIKPPGTTMLIKRAEIIPLHPIPDYAVTFVRKLMMSENCDINTMKLIYALLFKLPTLLGNIEKSNIIDFIFQNSKRILDFGVQGEDGKEVQQRSMLALLILCSICSVPHNMDFVITTFLNELVKCVKRNNGNDELFASTDLTVILLFLLSVLATETLQFVLTSLFIKFDWNGIATYFLKQLMRAQEPNHLINLNLILTVTKGYITLLNRITDQNAPIVDELMKCENPFVTTHLGLFTSPKMNIGPIAYFFTQFENVKKNEKTLISNPKQVFSQSMIQLLQLTRKNPPKTSVPQEDSELYTRTLQETAFPRPPHHYPLPTSINATAYSQLQEQEQAMVLYDVLPPLPEKGQISFAQKRYLLHQPFWVSEYVQKRGDGLLLTGHYLMLHQILPHLLQIKDNHSDINANDLILDQVCQHDLVGTVIDISIQSHLPTEIAENARKLLNAFSTNFTTFQASVFVFNEKIRDESIPPGALFSIIQYIAQSDDFPRVFKSYVSNSFLDLIAYWLDHCEYLNIIKAIHYFKEYKLYSTKLTIYLISLILKFDDANLKAYFRACVNVISDLPKEKFNEISRYIEYSFDRLTDNFTDDDISFLQPLLILTSQVKTRPKSLLNILDLELTNFQKEHLSFIGSLFDALSPPRHDSFEMFQDRNQTVKNQHETSKSSEDFRLPQNIRKESPEFWAIVEKHLKILLELVDDNYTILDKQLKFMKYYPGVLSFARRTKYFRETQKRRIENHFVYINVSRDTIMHDSLNAILSISPEALKGVLKIKFKNEEGVDSGGVTRDWFTTLITEILNPQYALFIPSSNGLANRPNALSYVNQDHLVFFKMAGRVIARSIMEGIPVPAHFTHGFLKHILGNYQCSMTDLEDADQELYHSFVWMLKNDVEPLALTFSCDFDNMGNHQTIDLVENGSNIDVTNDNKKEYISLMIKQKLVTSVEQQTAAFVEGFYNIIPLDNIQLFSPDELDLIICGIPDIDIDDMQRHTHYNGQYNADHPTIKSFFEVIHKWNKDDKAKLLMFITGTSQVPVGGFETLEDTHPITIEYGGEKDRLPTAHTCINTLDLPLYDNAEDLESKLRFSIRECDTFGFG